MFLYFNDNHVDIVILETGLGGRLDATNVIKENLCSIITKIDLDHTDKLGNTKEEIAYEKAGIIKSNSAVITSEGYEIIKDTANRLNSMLILVSPFVDTKFIDALALKGLHQTENLSLALTAINYIFPEIKENVILKALPKVNNPYRFQYFKDKNLIIDASHNPNGIKALRENLDYYFTDIKRRFIFGCLKTKDYKQMIEILFKDDDEIYFNEFDYPNACSYEELKNACIYKTNKYTKDLKLDTDRLNVICGSFYMIGKMKF